MKRKKNNRTIRHRVTPIWKKEFDRSGYARALLLLAMHLDETAKKAHIKQQNHADEVVGKEGGGTNESS